MADTITLDIVIDDTIDVTVVDSTDVDITTTEEPTFAVITVEGPTGDTGPAGPGYAGEAWFYGSGPPGTIIGSKPGDNYMDLDSGTIWKLGA